MHNYTPNSLYAGLRWGRCAVLALMLLSLTACGEKQSPAPALPVPPPSVAVSKQESAETFMRYLHPANQELHSWREMAPTVRKSLDYVKKKPQAAYAVDRADMRMTYGEMTRTLTRLLTLLPLLDRDPSLFAKNFEWIPVSKGIRYSGYYEPVLQASRTKKPGYEQPLYMRPPDLDAHIARHGKYYTRADIENKKVLAGKGLELAWAADPVAAFMLEIQGSGRLAFDDGTQAFINYAGQNKHKYKALGRLMRERGLVPHGNIVEIKEWLRAHPSQVREVLNLNPSYVFFRFGSRGPTGAMGAVVDDWMSLAVDRGFIPLGSVVAYGVNIPDPRGTAPLRGIGFAQDVGGAIKRNRIDIFCGDTARSEHVASYLDAAGPAWILRAK